MIRFGVVLAGVITLSACCSSPERVPDWSEYANAALRYPEDQLQVVQKAALLRYQGQADDENRMKLAWLLSRGDPSLQQLQRALELARQVAPEGPWAARSNLLQVDLENMIELQTTRGRLLELGTQIETKSRQLEDMGDRLETVEAQLETVETQLKAMKDIEARMTEDIDPNHEVPE